MKLPLDRLTVGQHGLRYSAEYLYHMMDFVADGGVWTEEALREYAARHGLRPSPLIQSVRSSRVRPTAPACCWSTTATTAWSPPTWPGGTSSARRSTA